MYPLLLELHYTFVFVFFSPSCYCSPNVLTSIKQHLPACEAHTMGNDAAYITVPDEPNTTNITQDMCEFRPAALLTNKSSFFHSALRLFQQDRLDILLLLNVCGGIRTVLLKMNLAHPVFAGAHPVYFFWLATVLACR